MNIVNNCIFFFGIYSIARGSEFSYELAASIDRLQAQTIHSH